MNIKKQKYWIELCEDEYSSLFWWRIKARNGRIKANSYKIYHKFSLCFNDALALADETDLQLRKER